MFCIVRTLRRTDAQKADRGRAPRWSLAGRHASTHGGTAGARQAAIASRRSTRAQSGEGGTSRDSRSPTQPARQREHAQQVAAGMLDCPTRAASDDCGTPARTRRHCVPCRRSLLPAKLPPWGTRVETPTTRALAQVECARVALGRARQRLHAPTSAPLPSMSSACALERGSTARISDALHARRVGLRPRYHAAPASHLHPLSTHRRQSAHEGRHDMCRPAGRARTPRGYAQTTRHAAIRQLAAARARKCMKLATTSAIAARGDQPLLPNV